MRPIAELLDFLTQTLSMQQYYQPAVILYLLNHNGIAHRHALARTLSGYDELDLGYWDRILMKNPKLTLVNTHNILNYDPATELFSLNFDLSDRAGVEQAKSYCEQKLDRWIQQNLIRKQAPDAEILRLYRVVEAAKGNSQYQPPELEPTVEEFAMRVAMEQLHQRFPTEKITPQPYHTPGFDILVGNPGQPTAYACVKATLGQLPSFWLTEGERQFSLEHADRFWLVVIYAINCNAETYEVSLCQGAITATRYALVPAYWQATLLPQHQV